MPNRNVVVVAGYWSTNIGNSFFQLGAEYLLRQLLPNDNIMLMSDQPGYWDVDRGNPENAFIPLEHMDIDYLVVQGPYLRPEFDTIWLGTLRKLQKQGVKLIVLSAGMMDYRQSSVQKYREWMAEYPPHIFTTRDKHTFDHVGDLAQHAYNGIDVAFFISDMFSPPNLTLENFVVFNFDKIPEPRFHRSRGNSESSTNHILEIDGTFWQYEFPRIRTALARNLKVYPFLDAFWPIKYPEHIGNLRIIRTDHRFNPLTISKAYKGPNSFVSDIPQTYLTLYANTKLTLSNRVHACVATLAYGNKAMLFSNTPRGRLLERVGMKRISEQPQQLDLNYLDQEKRMLIDFLSTYLVD